MHINYATHVVLPVCGCLNIYCLPVTWPWEYGLEIFLGLIFSPGNFWGFIGSHSDFSGGFLPSVNHSGNINSGVPPRDCYCYLHTSV